MTLDGKLVALTFVTTITSFSLTNCLLVNSPVSLHLAYTLNAFLKLCLKLMCVSVYSFDKKVEEESVQNNVSVLTGIKESYTGLAPPALMYSDNDKFFVALACSVTPKNPSG